MKNSWLKKQSVFKVGDRIYLHPDKKSNILQFGEPYTIIDYEVQAGVIFVTVMDGDDEKINMMFPINMFVPYNTAEEEIKVSKELEQRFKIW